MRVKIQDSWQPVTSEEIRDFEELIGAPLPADYREFLLAHNGGHFADPVKFREMLVEHFYGLNTGFAWSDLTWHYEIFVETGRVPISCLPVGSHPGGEICIVVSGERRGEVWSHDHEDEPDEDLPEDEKWDYVFLESKTFREFLDGLRPEPEPSRYSEPIFQAAELGDVDQVARLLDAGVDVNVRCADVWTFGSTVLGIALCHGRLDVIWLLIARGADVHASNSEGWPVAFESCRGQSGDALKILLENGVSPNAADAEGKTLLMAAVEWRAHQHPRILLDAGADVNARDKLGRTALAYCEEHVDEGFRKILEAAGARE